MTIVLVVAVVALVVVIEVVVVLVGIGYVQMMRFHVDDGLNTRQLDNKRGDEARLSGLPSSTSLLRRNDLNSLVLDLVSTTNPSC